MVFEIILIRFFVPQFKSFYQLTSGLALQWQLSSDSFHPAGIILFFLILSIKLGSIKRPHVRVKMGLDKILVISLTLGFYIGQYFVSFIHRQIRFIIFLFLVIFIVDKFEILWPKNYYFNQVRSWKLQNWAFSFWCRISNGKSLFIFIYFICILNL